MESEFQNEHGGQEELKHLSARVPDSIAKGTFCTGAVVMGSPQELVIDFIQTLVQPHQLVARVILPWVTVPNLIAALKINLESHARRFCKSPEQSNGGVSDEAKTPNTGSGPVTENVQLTPAPSSTASKKIRRIEPLSFYDDLRIDEEVLMGAYANGAIINHTEFEFKIDFLSTLHPYPIVVARVYLSEPQARRLLASLDDNQAKRRSLP
jgi:hypothetical protein